MRSVKSPAVTYAQKYGWPNTTKAIKKIIARIYTSGIYPTIVLSNFELFNKFKNLFRTRVVGEMTYVNFNVPTQDNSAQNKNGKVYQRPVEASFPVGVIPSVVKDKEDIAHLEIFPIAIDMVTEALRTDSGSALSFSFKDYLKKVKDKIGKKGLRKPEHEPLLKDFAKLMEELYSSLLQRFGETLDAVAKANQEDLANKSLAPIYIYLLLEREGIIDGMFKVLKRGELVNYLLDFICWFLLSDDPSCNTMEYSSKYITFSTRPVNAQALNSFIAELDQDVMMRVVEPDKLGGEHYFYGLVSQILAHLVEQESKPANELLSDSQMRKQVNLELEKLVAEFEADYAKKHKFESKKRGRKALEIPVEKPKFPRGRCPAHELEARKLKIAAYEKAKEEAKARNAASSKEHWSSYSAYLSEQSKARTQFKKEKRAELLNKLKLAQSLNRQRYYGIGTYPENELASLEKTMFNPQRRVGKRRVLFDLTTVLSTAEDNSFRKSGPMSTNKNVVAELFKLGVALDYTTGHPLRIQPFDGNRADNSTIATMIKTFKQYASEDSLFVMDRIFSASECTHQFIANKIDFLAMNSELTNAEYQEAKEAIAHIRGAGRSKYYSWKNQCFVDVVETTALRLGICNKEGKLIDSSGTVLTHLSGGQRYTKTIDPNTPLCLVVFGRAKQMAKEEMELIDDLNVEIATKNAQGNKTLNRKKQLERMLKIAEQEFEIDSDAVEAHLDRCICKSFLTSLSAEEAMDAFEYYSERWTEELFFKVFKSWLPGSSARGHSDAGIAVRVGIVMIIATLFRKLTTILGHYREKKGGQTIHGTDIPAADFSTVNRYFPTTKKLISTLKEVVVQVSGAEALSVEELDSEVSYERVERFNTLRKVLGLPKVTLNYALELRKRINQSLYEEPRATL